MDINRVFKVATDKQVVVCPPKQVFSNPNFKFILTIGGDLVGDQAEYHRFRSMLQKIGEAEFHILENIGATKTDRIFPYKATVSSKDSYNDFYEIVGTFEPPFGWKINHFFVFGNNPNWGIYVSEFPTVNIIGCTEALLDDFRIVFQVQGSGYKELENFLDQEFQGQPDLKKEFLNIYAAESKDDTEIVY